MTNPAFREALPFLEQSPQSLDAQPQVRGRRAQRRKRDPPHVSSPEGNATLGLRSRLCIPLTTAYGVIALVFAFLIFDAAVVHEPASAATAPNYTDITANSSVNSVAQFTRNTSQERWNHSIFDISWGKLENYQMLDKLGDGSYSEVFLGINKLDNESCVVKILQPVAMRRVKREIKILQELSGGPNIVSLIDVVRDNRNKTPSLVFEYVNNTNHKTLYPQLNDFDVRYYILNLLKALSFSHSKGIMHRDIKPYNVMIDHHNRKLRLIDWGLADFYDENRAYGTGVGSRYWRAPELLVGYDGYDYSADLWSVGCMLAGMVFQREPFFRGKHDDVDQLLTIARVLGTEGLFKYLHEYDIELDEAFDHVKGWYQTERWASFVTPQNRHLVSEDVIDLIGKLLRYNHKVSASTKQVVIEHTIQVDLTRKRIDRRLRKL
ncbi:Casein kinase II subunit alpha' [Elasticomyces elasticus]|nr:Casein kinase II subunit alpha' [Elasticomyces elasticus]